MIAEIPNVQQMKENRAQLISNAKVIVNAADEDKRDLTEEEEKQVDSLLSQSDEMGDQVEDAERKQRLRNAEDNLHQSKRQIKENVPYVRSVRPASEDKRQMRNILKAWMTYGQGQLPVSPDTFRAADRLGINIASNTFNLDIRANVEGTTTSGGDVVPQDFGDKIVEAMKYFCPIRNYITVIHSENGQPMPFPTNDDTTNLAPITPENSAVTDTDFLFNQKTLTAFNYKSLVRLSLELLQDSKFDLESFIARQLGLRIGRAQEVDLMTGLGSGAPYGLVPAATASVTGWVTTYANLNSLFYSVDPAYRRTGKWFMSDTVAAQVRGLVSSTGLPIINTIRGYEDAEVDSIFGKEVVISNSMAATGTGAKVIVFGDPVDYICRDVGSVSLIRTAERWVEYGLIGFLAWARMDANFFGTPRALKCGTLA